MPVTALGKNALCIPYLYLMFVIPRPHTDPHLRVSRSSIYLRSRRKEGHPRRAYRGNRVHMVTTSFCISWLDTAYVPCPSRKHRLSDSHVGQASISLPLSSQSPLCVFHVPLDGHTFDVWVKGENLFYSVSSRCQKFAFSRSDALHLRPRQHHVPPITGRSQCAQG